ncbi:hypothetical protein NP233_g3821 [Leucocoprinus birnbaumii]|uniref:Uncharacterized protein n=1 Tax=Leucocoprinus birnbaumii TaxID=56174 RepID=A0AAD5VZS2_9AGAR|nr:hypothetical protein NP233_g3821 [Leucocoprinus birnbaumii]
MLKRQRASSPVPQSPSIPSDVASSEGIIDIRNLKRRRVAPPSLDGQTRGWNTHPSNPSSAEEEYEEDKYVGDELSREAKFVQSETRGREGSNVEYAEVNSVLKEMHILHKHRQLFVLPVPPLPHVSQDYHSAHPEMLDKTRLSSAASPVFGYHKSTEESARVYEHYEGTNRSLASAFLSRRQHNTEPSQPS